MKVTVKVCVWKFESIIMFLVTPVIVSGFSVPVWSPVQAEKEYPTKGAAVTGEQSPPALIYWDATPLIVPPESAVKVTVHCPAVFTSKFAVMFMLLLTLEISSGLSVPV